MNVEVDTEKLAWGLEKGIGTTNTYFSGMPIERRLRLTSCGLVSAAIHSYALSEGIPSRLLISSPNLPFDPSMQHVVALIESDGHNPLVIDASASQFLGYAGITTAAEDYFNETLFPEEKILTFGLQESSVAVAWLAKAVRSFRDQHPTVRPSDSHIFREPLIDAPMDDVQQAYASIYAPEHLKTWMPPTHVILHGDQVANAIPDGTIRLSDN